MATSIEVWAFSVTCQPGIPATAPMLTNLPMPTRIVNRITVLIPPGPAGLMGFAFGSAAQLSIPSPQGTFIVSDHEVITLDLDNQIESGAWQVAMYNMGTFAHTIYIRFEVSLPERAAIPATLTPVPTATLNQAGQAGTAVTSAPAATSSASTGATGALPPPPTLPAVPTI